MDAAGAAAVDMEEEEEDFATFLLLLCTVLLVLLGMAAMSASNSSSPSKASNRPPTTAFEGATTCTSLIFSAFVEKPSELAEEEEFVGFDLDDLDDLDDFDDFDELDGFDDAFPKNEAAPPVFLPFNFFKGALDLNEAEEEEERTLRMGST